MSNKLRVKRMAIAFLLTISLFMFKEVISVKAATKYDINSYQVNIEVLKDYSYNVTEIIEANFITPGTGIVRDIPISEKIEIPYKGKFISEKLRSYLDKVSVDGEVFDKIDRGNFESLNLGHSDINVKGNKIYVLKYKVINYKDRLKDFDFFQWQILPKLGGKVKEFRVKIDMPKGVTFENIEFFSGSINALKSLKKEDKYSKYNGTRGEILDSYNKDKTKKVLEWSTAYDKDGRMNLTVKGDNLDEDTSIVASIILPDGYFSDAPTLIYYPILWLMMVLIFLLTSIFVTVSSFRGRENIRQFNYSTENMNPLDIAEKIANNNLVNEFVSTLFYLAQRSYLSIAELSEEGKKSILITRGNVPKDETKEIRNIISKIFYREEQLVLSSQDKEFWRDVEEEFLDAKSSLNKLRKKVESSFFNRILKLIMIFMTFASPAISLYFLIKTPGSGLFIDAIGFFAFAVVIAAMLIGMKYRKMKEMVGEKKYFVKAYAYYSVLMIISSLTFGYVAKEAWNYWLIGIITSVLTAILGIIAMEYRVLSREGIRKHNLVLRLRRYISRVDKNTIIADVEEDGEYIYNILPYAILFDLDKKWLKKFDGIHISEPTWFRPLESWTDKGILQIQNLIQNLKDLSKEGFE